RGLTVLGHALAHIVPAVIPVVITPSSTVSRRLRQSLFPVPGIGLLAPLRLAIPAGGRVAVLAGLALVELIQRQVALALVAGLQFDHPRNLMLAVVDCRTARPTSP